MNGFGRVAVRAVELASRGTASPREAWRIAAHEVFPESRSNRDKGCPRSAFLGLCEEGLVVGVPAGNYTTSTENKADAVRAAGLVFADPSLAESRPGQLWKRVMESRSKVHNSQMNVVQALHRQGLLVRK